MQSGQDSLSPVQRHRLSVEAEASLMNRGRGRQLAGLSAVGVAVAVAGLLGLQYLGRSQQYAQAAAATEQVEKGPFEGYFSCAVPAADVAHLSAATRVHTAFERVADRVGKKFAATLNSCGQRLPTLVQEVEGLDIPPPLSARHESLKQATAQLQQAHEGYLGYLQDRSKPYEFVQAAPLIEKLGVAFEAFRQANAELRRELTAGI